MTDDEWRDLERCRTWLGCSRSEAMRHSVAILKQAIANADAAILH
jgi:hypothetical protein